MSEAAGAVAVVDTAFQKRVELVSDKLQDGTLVRASTLARLARCCRYSNLIAAWFSCSSRFVESLDRDLPQLLHGVVRPILVIERDLTQSFLYDLAP
jgi:hypothetical protein